MRRWHGGARLCRPPSGGGGRSGSIGFGLGFSGGFGGLRFCVGFGRIITSRHFGRDGTEWAQAEEAFMESRQPSRRFVKDANVAGLIAFLCGPHGEDINGAALPIDGAWLAGR